MGKFRKRIVVVGCFILIGFIFYKSCRQSDDNNLSFNKKDLIAVYIQNEDNEYRLSSSKKFPKRGYTLNSDKSKCVNGGKISQDENTKVINVQISNTDSCKLYFDQIRVKDAAEALKMLNIKSQESTPNFAEPSTTDETAEGLFSMVDDSGKPSYYYRGAVENNYVKFGIDKDGNDMYWRIIRFNGDGSIRMQFDGLANGHSDTNFTYTKKPAIPELAWNGARNDAKYVGYMFGEVSTDKESAQKNELDSAMKNKVDIWYKENILETGYHDYIADEIFCNDRSTPGKEITGWESDTGLGYGTNFTGYGATSRLGVWNAKNDASKVVPIFTCLQDNDKFTVETENGNGALTYPVGLITADEIVAAGSGKYIVMNGEFYLKKDTWYWSFTPFSYNSDSISHIFGLNVLGSFNYLDNVGYDTYMYGSVYPVINIASEYISQLIGDGTVGNPYRLQ